MSLRLLACLLLLPCLSIVAADSPRAKPATGTAGIYKGYVVTDAATGEILLQDAPDTVTPPASMTKIMTFLLVAEAIKAGNISLDTPVPVTVEDHRMGGTQVYLDPKETFTVDELLYALMIQSANDAASALARTAAGSRELFVEKMNARASALGMTRTRFTTPHGLPPASRDLADGDLTTPADFARLCREAILTTDILKYSSVKKRPFGEGVRAEPQIMENHNKLLGRVAGVDGLKTGYTKAAGYCLSATAERGGRRLIVVIMGSFGAKGEVDMGRSRDLKTVELIERGFSTLASRQPASAPVATTAKTATAAAPAVVSPIAPAESGPVRTNLNPPRRPNPPPVESPIAPADATSVQSEEPTVKFVPIAPPVPKKKN